MTPTEARWAEDGLRLQRLMLGANFPGFVVDPQWIWDLDADSAAAAGGEAKP